MSDMVIKIENLGKKYKITHKQPYKYFTLRDSLMYRAKQLVKKIVHISGAGSESKSCSGAEDFWALKDVSFGVKQGERIGVIGRNGAGKSTLLKILSRITEPTTGRVSIKGRIASLLEVGTGFHPELTGRENIFLNGAILGMSRSEIKTNFDAIVDFSGVEQFLDTPVKRYSSGMYVRLAFAVAAHLETEILLVDEVLAVGDAEFQKKCMGKMDEVSHKQGRTIFFVSHNMEAIRQLSDRVVYLRNGEVAQDTFDVSDGIKTYLGAQQCDKPESIWTNPGDMYKNPWFFPQRIGLFDKEGDPVSRPVERKDEVWVEISGFVEKANAALCVGYALYAEDGALLYWSAQTDQMGSDSELPQLKGEVILRSRVPLEILNRGVYTIEPLLFLFNQEPIIQSEMNTPSLRFELGGSLGMSPFRTITWSGSLYIANEWHLR